MKPTRPPRPAPRTLAAAPPVQLRLPQPAAREARFPTLAVVLASGAVLPACADPVCGATRAEELEAHGRLGVQAARGGEASRALHEVGVALGVVAHDTTRVPDMVPAGAMPVITPTPPPRAPDPIPMTGGGAVAPVTPAPPPPTPPAQVTTPGNDHPPARPGGMRRVTPTPRPTPPPRPEPGLAVPGGLGAVGPLPAQLSHPRITRT